MKYPKKALEAGYIRRLQEQASDPATRYDPAPLANDKLDVEAFERDKADRIAGSRLFHVGERAHIEAVNRSIHLNELSKPLGSMKYGKAAGAVVFLSGDDAEWALESCGIDARPVTVALYGNEDSPFQVWGSDTLSPTTNDLFTRLA